MISVRRTDGLPQTSFRFHLTTDTLVLLAMCFPLTGALRTFTFKINARAERTDAGYQLKAIKLVVPRLALLDDDEFYYLVKLSDEMNKRASELPDTLPAILPVSASQTELARKLRMEEFEDVMNRILDEALCRHSADVNAQLADTICEKIGVQLDNVIAEKITEQVSTKVIKEMDYRMRLQDDEAEERFRKLDETLFMRRKKSREQKEAAASRLPWKRKHKT